MATSDAQSCAGFKLPSRSATVISTTAGFDAGLWGAELSFAFQEDMTPLNSCVASLEGSLGIEMTYQSNPFSAVRLDAVRPPRSRAEVVCARIRELPQCDSKV